MAEERIQRRLAAIVAFDIVGYSRLMSANEASTMSRLKTLRSEILEPSIEEFSGRVFKTTGDGALAEFSSAADAVTCAIKIQSDLVSRELDQPDSDPMELRIGISLGDVMVEDDDLYGNGVNIASRLEGLADPSGICVSGNVYEHVRNVEDLSFEDMGEQSVKNIDRSVRCYKVLMGSPSIPATIKTQETAITLATADKASIVVLPFQNMSGDPADSYFSDGMTEDLITDLSKVNGLFVIARNSSFAYKDRAIDVRQVGKELGVHHVLEGSVRRAGNRVRINAQLIDTTSGGHIWAERYDGDMDDIFALQDEITAQIVSALEINFSSSTTAKSKKHVTESFEAYELFLKARAAFYLFTPEQFAHCIKLYERAIEIDPTFAAAWSGQVFPYQSGYTFMWEGYDDGIVTAIDVARKGLSLDPNDGFTNWRLGWALTHSGSHSELGEEGIERFEKAILLNPDDAEAYAYFAELLNFTGYPARAIEMAETSLRYDPVVPPNCAFHLGHSLFQLGRLDEAQERIQSAIDLAPGFPVAKLIMATTLVELGKEKQARKQVQTLLSLHPRHTLGMVEARYHYRDKVIKNRVLEDLRKAGLPE